jgi:hypothetical protein
MLTHSRAVSTARATMAASSATALWSALRPDCGASTVMVEIFGSATVELIGAYT